MRYCLGIDYGTKYCGVARADLDSPVKIAIPMKIIENIELEDFIQNLSAKPEFIVLGESLNLSGKQNPINDKIKEFADFLQACGHKVFLHDERFSSMQALAEKRLLQRKSKSRKQTKKERIDASAATLILQSFLDKNLL